MSGTNNNDDDFLDDDFVVEGLADLGPRDDLGLLFTPADQPQAAVPPPAAVPDAEDDLFTDHTANLTPTETFAARPQFDEQAASAWNGDNLDLDDALTMPASGAPGESSKPEAAKDWPEVDTFAEDAEPIDAELEIVGGLGPAPADAAAELTVQGVVGEDLPSLEPVAEGEELPWLVPITTVDATDDLAVGVASGDGVPVPVEPVAGEDVAATTQAPAAPLANAEDALLTESAPAAEGGLVDGADIAEGEEVAEDEFTEGEEVADGEFAEGEEVAEDEFTEGEEVADGEFAEGEEVAEGEFAEGEEVADGEFAEGEEVAEGEFAEGEEVADGEFAEGEEVAEGEFAEGEEVAEGEYAEGEEVAEGEYAEGEEVAEGEPVGAAPVLAGPGNRSYRLATAFFGLAASCAIVAGAGLVVMRPEWIGLDLGPAQVTQVRVERPEAPRAIAAPQPVADTLVQVPPRPTTNQPTTETPGQVQPQPAPNKPGMTGQTVAKLFGALARLGSRRPAVGGESPVTPAPNTTTTTPPAETPPTNTPTATVATGNEPPTRRQSTGEEAWPVRATSRTAKPATRRRDARNTEGALVRIDDETMIGESNPQDMQRQAVDGVLPGLRAFALLQNGNFFVGRVKQSNATSVTLRTPEGEVSLDRSELVRIVGLGSADYEALQRATDGFVRLTNSNKLIGGILTQVADDHVVMEWRSNRVVLPRSVVGSIVKGQPSDEVQFSLSAEEDAWLRGLAERELSRDREAAQPKMPTQPEPGK